MSTIEFVASDAPNLASTPTLLVGRASALRSDAAKAALPAAADADLVGAMVASCRPGDFGDATHTWLTTGQGADAVRTKLVVGVLPEPCSRHNSPARPHAISRLVKAHAPGSGTVEIIVVAETAAYALASGAAVARAFPLYTQKSKSKIADREIRIRLVTADGSDVGDLAPLLAVANNVREAARLVDRPTSDLNTTAFVAHARAVAERVGVKIDVTEGEALRDGGFGGLWGVGRAARALPAMAVLTHEPKGAERTVVLVGKGIVYDTGGLSIKTKTGMPGMKRDMGGAAAALHGFSALVETGFPDRLVAVLCLAENAVGPDATRPDDIIQLYSGKTVEVNNTDAEGRLVLGDGVAWAAKHLTPDVIIDLATLTGAQLIATGRRHASIVSNDGDLEDEAVAAGRASGDLVHPLPYCPEFFRREFKSKVADLKNSVKDRANAQSSCAGQFVAEHLGDYEGRWLHVDMAGPGETAERGTGYGVALLYHLLNVG